ncbi:SGNH/GDSL hydrolase family protein, partial [Paraglaciecola sp.]|uniref:SGNH/GDSL hydrolase family protein n=1 Tax=Paraglaciecola sp. TaxID=1920173 RepID=UPI00273F0FFB
MLNKLLNLIKRVFKTPCILVLGDSHAAIFEQNVWHFILKKFQIYVSWVGGATVSGLENPNSKTQAIKTFKEKVKQLQPDIILLQLGEVDTGFVIWFRAEKYHCLVEEMTSQAIMRYEKLIANMAEEARVIVISAPLPTIRDGQDWGEIANARSEITASQYERTKLTLEFNKKINQFCVNRGFDYINLDQDSLGENGLVSEELM